MPYGPVDSPARTQVAKSKGSPIFRVLLAAFSLERHLTEKFAGPICVALVCGIMVACLWPFRSPVNKVTWLSGENGLRFDYPGTAASASELEPAGMDEQSCSVELWVQPAVKEDSSTLLAFHTAGNPEPFSLQQSESDLKLRLGPNREVHRTGRKDLYVDNVFRSLQPLFITVSSGTRGTVVYLNGVPARTAAGYRIGASDCSGRVVLGTSPVGNESWSGSVRRLAVYYHELTAEQALQHYNSRARTSGSGLKKGEQCAALFPFDEGHGRIVHDRARGGPSLLIPERYEIVAPAFLAAFWSGNLDIPDMLRNIIGFVPLGYFLFAAVSRKLPRKWSVLTVMIAGALLSLSMEMLQSYLPTRDSDSMDVVTNVVGTCLGLLLYRQIAVFWHRLRAV
jgi:hypothetical protein